MRATTGLSLVLALTVAWGGCVLATSPAPAGIRDVEHTHAGVGSPSEDPSDSGGTGATCTYYVAPSGRDGNPGTQSQPWASFQHAADTARPGETVCFRGGTYSVAEDIHLTQSGTPGSVISNEEQPFFALGSSGNCRADEAE